MTSPLPIENDAQRFKKIVRGHVRENLKKYISSGELIGKQGKEIVSIPIPQINLPRFKYGDNQGGVGQGKGEVGDPIGRGDGNDGDGQAGDRPGEHIIEVELSIEELAEILGEELELPHIKPKNKQNVIGEVLRFTGARRVGPEGLRYFKRTMKAALKRLIAEDDYDINNPVIIPIRDDKRYRSWKYYPCPESNAVIFYMMDISGSMTTERKELVRLIAFWIDTWIRAHYKNIIVHYIVHDTDAAEVNQQEFYTLRESGGTFISSAYKLCKQIIDKNYDPDAWNMYMFHFSDGDNWDSDDDKALKIVSDDLLPIINLFCYGQVKYSGYSSQFINHLKKIESDKLLLAQINSRDEVYSAIKIFLGKGL